MKMGPRLDLRQSQSLVMTPQLQQAIRLLALSNLEIESFIAEELDKNPLLEMGRDEQSPLGDAGDAHGEGFGEAAARDGGRFGFGLIEGGRFIKRRLREFGLFPARLAIRHAKIPETGVTEARIVNARIAEAMLCNPVFLAKAGGRSRAGRHEHL